MWTYCTVHLLPYLVMCMFDLPYLGCSCVQVVDNSRSDWWLVMSAEQGDANDSGVPPQGWVPANYLEKRIFDGPISPPPDPFEDEMGELANIMLK